MNYLAHLYLADDDPQSLIGSLMGDFVKGRIDESLSPPLRDGVWLHRRVDSFTDAHPLVKTSKRRISPCFRRYAGILVDVFYDHFLASNWTAYASQPLPEFADRVYRIVHHHHHSLPSRMQRSMRYMVDNDLLCSYRDIDGIARALRGIESRLKRPSSLHAAVHELTDHYALLERDFAGFFPELIDCVERARRTLPSAG